jgi:hypothetical protein
VTQPPPAANDQPDRCPRCQCDDCNGTLAQHAETGCTCDDCAAWSDAACTQFLSNQWIAYLAEALAPLLSAHLNARAARRCLAVAHAAHHALHDYDHPEDTR